MVQVSRLLVGVKVKEKYVQSANETKKLAYVLFHMAHYLKR